MRRQEKWRTVLEPVLEGTPFELIGVECLTGGKRTLVRVYVDRVGGITIDDIAHLSPRFSAVLDVEDVVRAAYTLEVSSPGLDRPLFLPEHFSQQVGQKVALKTNVPFAERQNFRGTLQKADENGIELEVEGQSYSFTYTDIDKARVIPDIKVGKSKNEE